MTIDADRTRERPYIIFGYGSLIWKPPPHVVVQIPDVDGSRAMSTAPGYLKGYNPGRVVTLIHKEEWDHFSASDPFPDDDVVWGVAYTIDPAYESEVRDYLDYREKDGYTLEGVDVHGIVDGHEHIVLPKTFCYVGRPDNPSFIGSQPIDELAERIWQSVGPSGPNKEYLYHLADAVRRLAPEAHDSHLTALETRCKAMDERAKGANIGNDP
ncbi:ChaC-like protein [Epithele typhae]|uniref:ChaC-like protein n=1 Tax=Epithele typhae TaxID=378194 RepID=UPI002007AC8E|nr:ChaC-like protein [Epithele typhae]KAH9927162.1 ChaC-like protein [Epithele typhae]